MDAELTTGIPARPLALPLRLLGDERLARLVGSGHEEAFSILYQRHHQALYRYCRSLVGSDVDAQDALQSAMTGALVALRVGRRDAPIRPWLFRIAYNESMTQLRRRRPTSELHDDLPTLESSPEQAVEERSEIRLLLADLRELPERQRGALVMRELSGLSHQEVAQALGMSIGATKQTVFEARRSLQEFDEGRAMACENVRRLISDGDGRSLRGRRVRAHLRDCGGCAAFAAAIPQRRADLRALTPVLPASAAAGLLWRITGAGSGQASGGAGLIGGAASKAVVTAASGKLLTTGALIVATAAVGTGGILRAITPGPGPQRAPALSRSAGPAPLAGGATANGRASASSARLLAGTRSAGAGSPAHSQLARAAGSSHGKSSSAAPGHTKGASNGSGLTRGHQGRGQGVAGSSSRTHGGHRGALSNSGHASRTKSKTRRRKLHRTRSTSPGSTSATHRLTGSGTLGGSATDVGGATVAGPAQGPTSQATSATSSPAGAQSRSARIAPSAG